MAVSGGGAMDGKRRRCHVLGHNRQLRQCEWRGSRHRWRYGGLSIRLLQIVYHDKTACARSAWALTRVSTQAQRMWVPLALNMSSTFSVGGRRRGFGQSSMRCVSGGPRLSRLLSTSAEPVHLALVLDAHNVIISSHQTQYCTLQ